MVSRLFHFTANNNLKGEDMTFWSSSKSRVVWWALSVVSCLVIAWTVFLPGPGSVLSQNASNDPKLRGLFFAAFVAHPEKLGERLDTSGYDVNVVDRRGDTLLIRALRAARARMQPTLYGTVALLLQRGADPHIANTRGRTAMHAAAMIDHEAVMTALIQAGGDPLINSSSLSTPYEIALTQGNWGTVAAIERAVAYRPADLEELKERGRVFRTLRKGLAEAKTVEERKAAMRAAYGVIFSDRSEAEEAYQKTLKQIQASGTGFLGDCDSCEKAEE